MKNLLTAAWTNFAKFGDPSPPGSQFHWAPVENKIEAQNGKWYFNISGHQSAMDGRPEIYQRLKVWSEVEGEGEGGESSVLE